MEKTTTKDTAVHLTTYCVNRRWITDDQLDVALQKTRQYLQRAVDAGEEPYYLGAYWCFVNTLIRAGAKINSWEAPALVMQIGDDYENKMMGCFEERTRKAVVFRWPY
jgi:hypothetical protein